MRQITLAATLILLSVPAFSLPPAAPVAAPASLIEVHLPSPLVDMHFWARKLASSGGEPPALPGLAAAVATLRELDAQLGRPSLPLAPVWGAVDLHALRAGTAAEFRQAVAALPETVTLPGGLSLPRAGIVRLAEAYLVLEKPFLEQVWPWHKKMIEHASATLEQDLLPHTGEIYADIHRSLGFPVPAQPIPLQLVAEAPHPGGVTYVAEVGRGLCLVAVDTPVGSLWLESVIHESIHALDLTGESALDILRQRLGTTLDPPLPAREAWNVSHAVMFAQAAGTVRRVLAPRHQDYGEASGVYQRLPKGAEVAEAWQAWMRGEITRDAAIERIVDGFRTKEKGDPKAAPVPPTDERPR